MEPTTRTSTPPQSGRIAQQSSTSAVVPQAYDDTDFPSVAFTNQLAIDLTDRTMAYYDANGAWQKIRGGADYQTYYGPTAPTTGVNEGDRWFNTVAQLWYTWNSTVGSWMPGNTSYASTAPADSTIGQAWFDPSTKTLQFWTGTAWISASNPAAPGVYAGAMPAAATAGSRWTDTSGVAWICITSYTSGGVQADWEQISLSDDPLAGMILANGDIIVAKEDIGATLAPLTSVIPTTGLVWLDLTRTRLGQFFCYDGVEWMRVYSPSTVDLCLALLSAGGDIAFLNTDVGYVVTDTTITMQLTYVPIDGSLHVRQNGLDVPAEDVGLDGRTLSFDDPHLHVGDKMTAAYAYLPIDQPDVIPINPTLVGTTTATGGYPSYTISVPQPAGTQPGDLLVISARGWVGPGGGDFIYGTTSADARVTALYSDIAPPVAETIYTGFATADTSDIMLNVTPNPSYNGGATVIMAVFRGVNAAGSDWGVDDHADTNVTAATPIVAAQAAAVVTWCGNSSFSLFPNSTPDNYTFVTGTGLGYFNTTISWWHDPTMAESPSGNFYGEGCLVIPLV